MDSAALPAGYRMADGPPAVADYLLLRDRAGLVDMAVLPEQRRGLGDVILTVLLERIRREAPAGAYVNLIADPTRTPGHKRCLTPLVLTTSIGSMRECKT